MQILHTWKESFSIFVPKNLKLFLLVTLNAIIDTFTTLLKYWWFLYAILLFLFTPMLNWVMVPIVNTMGGVTLFYGIFTFKIAFIPILIFFLTCLAARPSTWLKNYAYFGRYLLRFWYVPFLILFFLMGGLHKIPLMALLFLLYILFLIDSDGAIMSIGWSLIRAIKMLIYNLPLFIIIEVLMQGFTIGISFLHLGLLIYTILLLIILPLFVCLVTNIYVKKLHDQSELYFPTPK